MKQPKTKPERKIQIKLSVPQSVADACKAACQEAADTPFDWNLTMVEKLERETAEFREFVAQYKAKSQPNAGLTSSPPPSSPNGADRE